jgi:hypothetical protein
MSNNDIVIIELDRPRQLKFGHTALKTLEELTGITITALDEQMDLMNHELREKVIYCGLLKDAKDQGETLNLNQIPALLDEAPSIFHVLEKATKAWRVAFGQPAELPEGNPQLPVEQPAKEKSSTGTKAAE